MILNGSYYYVTKNSKSSLEHSFSSACLVTWQILCQHFNLMTVADKINVQLKLLLQTDNKLLVSEMKKMGLIIFISEIL